MNLIYKVVIIVFLIVLSQTIAVKCVSADDLYFFMGGFVYDNSAEKDYGGQSPNGYVGIKYQIILNDKGHINLGLKHESSVHYTEKGGGFNGAFFDINVKMF